MLFIDTGSLAHGVELVFWCSSSTLQGTYVASSSGIQPSHKPDFEAGTLAVINLMPVFAGPHLSTLADLLGVSLSMFRQIHRSAGMTAVALAIFHVLVMVASQPSFSLDLPQNLFAVIGASSLRCTILLCLSLFRRPSYELFLRSHQALAALSAYSIWRHLPSEEAFPRTYLYISAGLFLFMCIVQGGTIIHHNGVFRYSRARAQITHEHGAVRVRIQLQAYDWARWSTDLGFLEVVYQALQPENLINLPATRLLLSEDLDARMIFLCGFKTASGMKYTIY